MCIAPGYSVKRQEESKMDEKTPQERFCRCLYLIEKWGGLSFEQEARQLADGPVQQEAVNSAMARGASILYSDYLGLIREGQVDYAPFAGDLAQRFGFSRRTLDSALRLGIETSKRPTLPKRE